MLLEKEIEQKYAKFVILESASSFSSKEARRAAGRARCTVSCFGDDCYVIKFRDSIVPAGPYTPAAIAASKRENGRCAVKRYQGHRIRIKYHFSNRDIVYTGWVQFQNGDALTLVDVVDCEKKEPRKIEDDQRFVLKIKDVTEIEILD